MDNHYCYRDNAIVVTSSLTGVRINVLSDQILLFEESSTDKSESLIRLMNGEYFRVKESFDQISEMLGGD